MQRSGVVYTMGFAAAVCAVCSVVVATSAVVLKDKQDFNARLDKQKKILSVSGLVDESQKISGKEAVAMFDERVRTRVVDLETNTFAENEQAILDSGYDQQKAASDKETSVVAPKNSAQVARIPEYALVYEVLDENNDVQRIVLPVEGKGLWSTLYGYIALEKDLNTIAGLTFYKHGETPGLGGEVDNPRWKGLWPGRQAYGEDGDVKIRVIKGAAGTPEEAPFSVDGLSGATITSNGVTHLLEFWLGENGLGPFLDNYRQQLAGGA